MLYRWFILALLVLVSACAQQDIPASLGGNGNGSNGVNGTQSAPLVMYRGN